MGVSPWTLYAIQGAAVVSAVTTVYGSLRYAYATHYPPQPLPPSAAPGSHLARYATPSPSPDPPPKKSDFAHAALHFTLTLLAIAIAIAIVAMIWYDFTQERAEQYQTAIRKRAEAHANWHRCGEQYPPGECAVWQQVKDLTDDTIARNAFHAAWSHIGEHAHAAWAEIPLNTWSIIFFMVMAMLYWIWTGPLQSARHCIDLCLRRRLHAETVAAAATAGTLADDFAALPVTGTLPTTSAQQQQQQWTIAA